jgi:quercetin dioxygenase-like cupin family protein
VPIVHHHDVPRETFRTGMTYQTLVGDERGSTPVRVGIQTSAPGSKTPVHSHPYLEVLTVLEGQGEAWIEGGSDSDVSRDHARAARQSKTLVSRHW